MISGQIYTDCKNKNIFTSFKFTIKKNPLLIVLFGYTSTKEYYYIYILFVTQGESVLNSLIVDAVLLFNLLTLYSL